MNAVIANWQTSTLWQVAGWTMCYFLILGTLIALLGAAARYLCNRAAPTVRYAVSLAVFATLAISPIAIAAWLTQAMPTNPTAQSTAPPTQPTIDLAKIPAPPGQKQIAPPSGWEKSSSAAPQSTTEQSHPKDGTMYALEWAVAYLPWLWILGTPLTFALLATGLVGSERLRRTCKPLTDGPIVETLDRLRASLGVSKRVAVAACDRIAQPVLVGIVRPLILLPSAAITGWSPEQLEMVLLHELAHVRRWDNLVNLLQRIVESLLFFHPAVWLVSRQIRRDREQCCDAIVVAHTAKPQAYAELLVSIAASPPPLAGLALARHPLTARIRRILELEDEPMLVSRKTLGLITIAAVLLVGVTLWQPAATTIAEEPGPPEEQNAEVAEDAEKEERGADGASEAAPANPVFLPLEQQKIVDQAYKLLGVELGLPGPEELVLAKENKFEGGLIINAGPSVFARGGGGDPFSPPGSGPFLQGDLLVGLHVWPIKSFEDVSTVLKRDDIAELSPLKFFVLRDGAKHPGSGLGTEVGLVTGRVPVNLEAAQGKPDTSKQETSLQEPDLRETSQTSLKPRTISPGDTLLVHVEGAFQDRPIDGQFTVEPAGTLALGPTYGRVNVVGKTLLEAEKAVLGHLSKILADALVQITWATQKNESQEDLGHLRDNLGPRSEQTNEATLLYDGKTFDQWREMWNTELKTEKRTECIKALAAFGRAGYGKEAAEAILDVAGEYDFSVRANNPEGRLKSEVIQFLADRSTNKHGWELLLDRYDDNQEEWRQLLYLVLYSFDNTSKIDEQNRKSLVELAKTDAELRNPAVSAILRSDDELRHPKTVELVRESLRGDQPNTELLAILRGRHLDQIPEQVDLFFHDDSVVRNWARRRIFLESAPRAEDSRELFQRLLEVLDDPEQSAKHANAIRAIATGSSELNRSKMNTLKRDILKRLNVIVREGDQTLLGPSLLALERILGKQYSRYVEDLVTDTSVPEERRELLSDPLFIDGLMNQERRE